MGICEVRKSSQHRGTEEVMEAEIREDGVREAGPRYLLIANSAFLWCGVSELAFPLGLTARALSRDNEGRVE